MNINPINRKININLKANGEISVSPGIPMEKEDNDLIMKELDKMSSINNVNIAKKDFEF